MHLQRTRLDGDCIKLCLAGVDDKSCLLSIAMIIAPTLLGKTCSVDCKRAGLLRSIGLWPVGKWVLERRRLALLVWGTKVCEF